MTKREARLKAALMAELKRQLPHFVVFAHAESIRSGVPDWSITGNGRTTWWEFKHATPRFATNGLQELTCLRLAAAGCCRYVVWIENERTERRPRTLVVHPKDIRNVTPEAWCWKFDHRWLVGQVRVMHGIEEKLP